MAEEIVVEKGFTPEQKTHLSTAIVELKAALETKTRTEIEGALKTHAETINKSIEKFQSILTEKDDADKKNQKALDEVLTQVKDMQTHGNTAAKANAVSFQEAFAKALQDPENIKGIANVKRGQGYKLMLKGPISMAETIKEMYNPETLHKMENPLIGTKTVGNITMSNNVTGQGYVSLSNSNVILPNQRVNARDLVRTVHSESGTYVFFRESAGEGSISRQTAPGAAKTQIDFDFARVEVVSEYIAGFVRYAKQLQHNLPFLVQTLPRLLMREFFKVENRRFWDIFYTAAVAGGQTVNSSETDDVKEIIDTIATLAQADYVPAVGLLSWIEMARIMKYGIDHGYFNGAGSFMQNSAGGATIMGVPIVPVSWVPSNDKFATFDADYIERIEVESLAIEFFEQDSDNVQKNLITARIECFEEFNILQPAATAVRDLGNSSTS